MKITVESTSRIVTLNGVMARIWEGTTESGIAVTAFVTCVAVKADTPADALRQFEDELQECRPPSEEVASRAFGLRSVL